MENDQHMEILRGIADEILRIDLHGYELDNLMRDFRSELKLKPNLPDFSDTALRHALADVAVAKYGKFDPVKAGKFVLILNSEGKSASIPIDMAVHMDGMMKEVENTEEGSNSLGFGIRELDHSFGGFYPGDVMALVGAPGSMKTSLALNMVYDCWKKFPKGRVAFFSLDMSTKKLAFRIAQRELDDFRGVIWDSIRHGDPETLARMKEIRREMSKKIKLIGQNQDGRDLTWPNIRDLIISTGADFIVIDYFQLIAGYRSDMDLLRTVLPLIVAMAGNYGMRFLLLSQIARAGQADQKNKLVDHGAGEDMLMFL